MDQPGADIIATALRSGLDFHFQLAAAVPLSLLLGCLLILVLGKRWGGSGILPLILTLFSAGAAILVLSTTFVTLDDQRDWTWLEVAGHPIKVGIALNPLSVATLALVGVITSLVVLFSMAYMRHDPMRHRYWAFLCLFAAAMCGLVLASNLFMMFICWELVGLASYLLIGFWHREMGPAKGSYKAFIVNRIADAGFVMALMLIWDSVGSFNVSTVAAAGLDPQTQFWIGLGLLVGAMGKSAQFPFQVWLPDAMAGPTPVSSLLHAATMVAAGVYQLVLTSRLFGEELLTWVAVIGAATALLGAFSALSQTDIKKVLAYSTVSQLGFMVMGIGVGAGNYSYLHLATHAFFKCGLFLAAAAVIHQQHAAQSAVNAHFDAQDMRFMGGLRKSMPLVFVCWLFFAASLAGLPMFSGFLSKDGLVLGVLRWAESRGGYAWLIPASAIVSSAMTAFYIARQGMLVFGGRSRARGAGAAPEYGSSFPRLDWRMAIPLVLLALASTWILFSPTNPLHFGGESGVSDRWSWLPWALAGLSIASAGLAIWVYRKGPLPNREGLFSDMSREHFHLDVSYQWALVRPFLALSRLLKWIERYVLDGAVRAVAAVVLRRAHRPSLSETADWMDHHLIDPITNEVTQTAERLSLSRGIAWLDQKGVDRLVNGVAHAAMRAGKRIGRLQTGKLQNHLLYTLLALLLLLLALIYIFTA